VCAERGIARQVRMVAARHGFSRGRLSTVVISLAFRLDESPKPSLQTSRFKVQQSGIGIWPRAVRIPVAVLLKPAR
jgi:hypothetical protein